MSKKKKAFKISLIIVNVILLIGLGFSSVFFFMKYSDLKDKTLTNDQLIAKYEKEISKTFTLPVGDKTSLVSIKDKEADVLKKEGPNKEFFKDSKDGDILLLYQNAKLGIVYRPSTKKIIKTGPAAITQQVALAFVGSKADRDTAQGILAKAFPTGLTASSSSDAKTTISSTVVVDISGNNKELAANIAKELKGTVGSVPEGEDKPADGTGIAIYVTSAVAP